ncbi:putative iron-regulated protein [Duganella sp. SG902]|uniref:ChaN family lipoprotein n=1 Tax=Duganella sp. SG902 TaxID=2587016 RepID=UPI00181895FB|nr:ChaN family lipoprotein [Duganella sp. SG902]NVM75011.1 putative iron-regulated protein [Duganella sp. SG902]
MTSGLAAAVLLAGCASGGKPAGTLSTGLLEADNPQVLLLGEVHDNAEGHKLRYELLRQRVEAGWRPVLVMEQFDRENQDLLTKAQKGCLDAQCVIRVAGGARWDWQLYYPVIQLALDHQLALVAGNLSRADASRVVRDGVASSFDPQSVKEYKLDQPLPAAVVGAQQQEIMAGHCNMLPEMMAGGMVNAQVARDVWMARIIRDQLPRDVVLIAGNGHVRKDIGVGYWLRQVAPALKVRSVGFIEGGGNGGRYDSIQTVAPQTRDDPCKQVKK